MRKFLGLLFALVVMLTGVQSWAYEPCTFPWGGEYPHGASYTAFATPDATTGKCAQVPLYCHDGVWTGDIASANQTCPTKPQGLTFEFSKTSPQYHQNAIVYPASTSVVVSSGSGLYEYAYETYDAAGTRVWGDFSQLFDGSTSGTGVYQRPLVYLTAERAPATYTVKIRAWNKNEPDRSAYAEAVKAFTVSAWDTPVVSSFTVTPSSIIPNGVSEAVIGGVGVAGGGSELTFEVKLCAPDGFCQFGRYLSGFRWENTAYTLGTMNVFTSGLAKWKPASSALRGDYTLMMRVRVTGAYYLDKWSDYHVVDLKYLSDHCANGEKDGDEIGIDCGGSCAPCPETCEDGILNQGEERADCGGPCSPCPTLNLMGEAIDEAVSTMESEGRTGIIVGLEIL